MFAKKIGIAVLLACSALRPAFSADYYILAGNENDAPPPGLETITKEFTAAITDSLKKHYPGRFANIIPNPLGQTFFTVLADLAIQEKYTLELTITVARTIGGQEEEKLYHCAKSFKYGEKESLLAFIAGRFIQNLAPVFEGGNTAAMEELINNIDLQNQEVAAVSYITPEWKNIAPDDRIYPESLVLKPELAGFHIEKKSDNPDNYLLAKTYIPAGDIAQAEEPALRRFLGMIKPVVDAGSGGREQIALRSGAEGVTSYEAAFYAVLKNEGGENNEDFSSYRLNSPGETRRYRIRNIPGYNFSIDNFRLSEDSLICTFAAASPLIYDPRVFLDSGGPQKNPAHYLYINEPIADFLNTHTGGWEVLASENFDMEVSLVKFPNPYRRGQTQFQRIRSGPAEERNKSFIALLDAVNQHGQETAKAVLIRGNRYSLPLAGAIDPAKDDWFIKMQFNEGRITGDGGGVILLRDIINRKGASGLPVSDETAEAVMNFIMNTGRPGYSRNVNYYLDIAKLLMYLGERKEALEYITWYQEGLGEHYGINNANERYKIEFYKQLAGYYYAARKGGSFSYTPPDAALLNPELEPDGEITRMLRFTGGDETGGGALADDVLFEIRKKSAGEEGAAASEFLRFNYPRLLQDTIFKLPGVTSKDVTLLSNIFIP
jgi:hypothetical protein